MGKRTSKQAPMFVAATELPVSPGHPFYAKLNTILDGAGFDRFAEEQCQRFYAPVIGRPSLPPGRYFRLLLVGYFEGLDSERGMAWRAADSLAVRTFVGLDLDTAAPDHSTISRTRRLIDVETLYRGATGHLSARYRGGRRPTGLVGADRGSGRKC
jgi:transposase